MSGQIFTLKVLGDKRYQLVSDGGFSAQALWASHSIKTA